MRALAPCSAPNSNRRGTPAPDGRRHAGVGAPPGCRTRTAAPGRARASPRPGSDSDSRRPRLPEVAGVDHALRTAGTADLDAIVEPVHVRGRVRVFVGPVHDGVANELLHGVQGVGRVADLDGPGQEIDGHTVVCDELVVEPPHDIGNCTRQTSESVTRSPNSVPAIQRNCAYAPGRKSCGRFPRTRIPATVGTGSSTETIIFAGGESLFRAPVVAGQRLRIDGRREIVLLEAPQTDVGEAGPGRPARVEVRSRCRRFSFRIRSSCAPAWARRGPARIYIRPL